MYVYRRGWRRQPTLAVFVNVAHLFAHASRLSKLCRCLLSCLYICDPPSTPKQTHSLTHACMHTHTQWKIRLFDPCTVRGWGGDLHWPCLLKLLMYFQLAHVLQKQVCTCFQTQPIHLCRCLLYCLYIYGSVIIPPHLNTLRHTHTQAVEDNSPLWLGRLFDPSTVRACPRPCHLLIPGYLSLVNLTPGQAPLTSVSSDVTPTEDH